MEKPKPKKELVVHHEVGRLVCIYYTSDDARMWAEKEADSFGQVEVRPKNKYVQLLIQPNFDVPEVIAYLDSYNNQ